MSRQAFIPHFNNCLCKHVNQVARSAGYTQASAERIASQIASGELWPRLAQTLGASLPTDAPRFPSELFQDDGERAA